MSQNQIIIAVKLNKEIVLKIDRWNFVRDTNDKRPTLILSSLLNIIKVLLNSKNMADSSNLTDQILAYILHMFYKFDKSIQ